MKPHYRALQGPGKHDWYVYDNWKDQTVKSCKTREEARRITVGMNKRWINEVEEAPSGDSAAQRKAR